MAAWDVVGPLAVLLAAGGVGWAAWRLTPNRRRNAELDATRRLAEAEADKWKALSRVANIPGQQPARGTSMEWDDLSDGELHARITYRRPDLPGEVVDALVAHREGSSVGVIITDIFGGEP